jgi:hypothetical protein
VNSGPETSAGGALAAEGTPAVLVHGVVAAGAPGLPPDARVVAVGDLAALVGELPAEGQAKREDLERHQQVLSRAIASTTVLPMRFGVVVESDDAVRREVLERNAGALRALLAEFDGLVQMTLKAFYAEDVLLREVLGEEPEIARLSHSLRGQPEELTRDARIELGRRVAAAVELRRGEDRTRLRAAVEPVVEDVVEDEPPTERVAAQLQLLVERDRRAELDAVVERLAAQEEGRLSLRYLGPLPPFSFANMQLDAEAREWG